MRVEHHGWHTVCADWLKANGLKGALTELRAMVWPHISRRIVQDRDASIGTPRRVPYRALPTDEFVQQDKPGANMRRNVPQPTGIVWDSPIKRKIRHGWLGKSATRVDG